MVRSYSSPLKCTVNGLEQRGWFLRQCLNLEATQQPSFLCCKRFYAFLFSYSFVLSVQVVLCCQSLPLSNPSPVPGYQSSLQSTSIAVGCAWFSCYLCPGSPPKEMGESYLGKGNAILGWVWETAALWVCSMYYFYSICPKYQAARQLHQLVKHLQ